MKRNRYSREAPGEPREPGGVGFTYPDSESDPVASLHGIVQKNNVTTLLLMLLSHISFILLSLLLLPN